MNDLRLPDLRALSSRPILYADATAAAAMGLPPHVRAASSLALVSDRLYAVQDDVHALARIDPVTALAEPIALPLDGPLARSRDAKADLEACALTPSGQLLVLGSGSRPERRVALLVDLPGGAARVLDGASFYAWLGETLSAAGASGTNIEGLTIAGDFAHVLHRGTGRGGGPSAVVRLPTSELLRALENGERPTGGAARARTVDLGELDGTRLSWTDGVEVYGLGIVFTASAEDTSDPTEDGACKGSVLGVFDRRGRVVTARLLEPSGEPLLAKVEGIALAGRRAWLVVDADDPDRPSELIEVPFGGFSPT